MTMKPSRLKSTGMRRLSSKCRKSPFVKASAQTPGLQWHERPVWASLRSLLCAALFPTAPLSRGGCSSLRLTPLSSARFNTPPK